MKLGEALTVRKDLETRQKNLLALITTNMVVEDGVTPEMSNEEFSSYMTEVVEVFEQRKDLISRINKTNVVTQVEDGQTLADLLLNRAFLKETIEIGRTMLNSAKGRRERGYGDSSVVVYVPRENAAGIRAELDEVSKAFRELDVKIQGLNWTTDLVD